MPDYAVALNRDLNGIKTAARYDTDAATWLNDVANYAKNAGGLWVPVSTTDPMPARVSDLETLIGALAAVAESDPTASASVIAALKGVLADLGQISDALVDAGATGSLSAKLRRLTTDLDTLLTNMGEVDANPTENTVMERLKALEEAVWGSKAEAESAQHTEVATTAQTYNRAGGATLMEVYVESGSVRVRTDGSAATSSTGEPLGPGYYKAWNVAAISVYYAENSTITVVSK